MSVLELTLKIGCSNNCLCCPQDKLIKTYKDDKKEMSYGDFLKILNNVPKYVDIFFSGFCEIYLNELTSYMLQEVKKHGHNITIYTTLVGATERDIQVLKEINPRILVIHKPDDNYFKYNIAKWTSIYNLVEKYKIKHTVTSLDHSNTHSRAGNNGDSGIYMTGKIGCSVGENQRLNNNIVLPNGDVYLCCMDYGLKHKLGNLITQTWNEIHNGDAINKLRDLMNQNDSDILCRKCVCSQPI